MRSSRLAAAIGPRIAGTAICVAIACVEPSAADTPEGAVSFTRDIAPVVFAHCASCHRPGGPAPFDLLSYRDLRAHSADVAKVTRTGFMPPWQPEPGDRRFVGERRLTGAQVDLFQRWVEGGSLEGDPADLPALPRFSEGWQLGPPDLIVKQPRPYTLPAEGLDVIRNFVVPIPVASTRYVRAVELRPGNPRIVHHAIVKTDSTRISRRLEADDDEPGFAGMMMGNAEPPDGHYIVWAPGTTPRESPEGISWQLEPPTDFVLQLHMVPVGKPETIQPEIGIYFAESPPTLHPLTILMRNEDLDIPAGKRDHVVETTFELPVPVEVLSLYPHAHYLGRQMQIFARLPGGNRADLLRIDDWDFNWQDMYHYEEPFDLPAGAELVMRYTFDNSSGNVQNPSYPPVRVVGGNRSTDEMATLAVQVLARDSAERGTLQAAQFLEFLKKNPNNATAHYNLGVVYASRNDLDRAAHHYAEAVRLNPGDAGARFYLANVYNLQGKLDQAAAHYTAALRIAPNLAEAHFLLGRIHARQGSLPKAETHLKRALQIDPGLTKARTELNKLQNQTKP